MLLDVFVAGLLCLVTMAMGYLGVHVTLHPTEEPRKRFLYKLAFWCCGLVAVGLITTQTVRNAKTQAAFRAQLSEIEKGIKTRPVVNIPAPIVNIPSQHLSAKAYVRISKMEGAYRSTTLPKIGVTVGNYPMLIVGAKASLNIDFINTGTTTADDNLTSGRIYIVPQSTLELELIRRFREELKLEKSKPGGRLDSGGVSYEWFSVDSDKVLTQNDFEHLCDGTERLFLLVSESHRDPSGHHYAHYCWVLQQPPRDRLSEAIWHFCEDFTDHD